MGEVGLGRLGVVEGAMTHSSPGGAEGERPAVKQVPTPVPVLGGLVHNLITGIHVVTTLADYVT